MAKTNSCPQKDPERLNKVGGQAVIEGVMMKAGEKTVTTCRKEDGSLVVTDSKFVSVRKKLKFLNIPILRGVVNFIEMLILSFKTLSISADAIEIEEEKKDGKKGGLTFLIMIVSLVLGVGIALLLFMYLPILIANLINYLAGHQIPTVLTALIEGAVKIIIFVLYLTLVSLMPDIKRTFMYHGAEHKSIACFEAGEELTPENARKHTRFHPRCGTSFMFVMILLGIFASVVVRTVFEGYSNYVIYAARTLTLPLVMGIGYEFIMIAGKHDNFITRMLSAPGLWMQRITTFEPTDDMLEVAIISIKCALRDDFPEFREFYDAKGWEKKKDNEIGSASAVDSSDSSDSVDAITERESCECHGGDREATSTEKNAASEPICDSENETADSNENEI